MKSDLMDVALYSKYLEDKGLAMTTLISYVGAVKAFLKTNPDIDDKNEYMKFIVKSMRHDIDNPKHKDRDNNMFLNFYAIKKYVLWKFSDNVSIKNELIDYLENDDHIKRLKRQKRTNKPVPHLSEDDFIRIINNFEKEKHQILFIIQWRTGVRIGDILNLKREDALLQKFYRKDINKEIEKLDLSLITKGNVARVISLWGEYKDIVYSFIMRYKVGDYVFIEDDRKFKRPLNFISINEGNILEREQRLIKHNYDKYYVDLKFACEKANVNSKFISTHFLRRNFARNIYDRYRDVEVLKRALNHANVNTSLLYLQNSGQSMDEVFYTMQSEKLKSENDK